MRVGPDAESKFQPLWHYHLAQLGIRICQVAFKNQEQLSLRHPRLKNNNYAFSNGCNESPSRSSVQSENPCAFWDYLYNVCPLIISNWYPSDLQLLTDFAPHSS